MPERWHLSSAYINRYPVISFRPRKPNSFVIVTNNPGNWLWYKFQFWFKLTSPIRIKRHLATRAAIINDFWSWHSPLQSRLLGRKRVLIQQLKTCSYLQLFCCYGLRYSCKTVPFFIFTFKVGFIPRLFELSCMDDLLSNCFSYWKLITAVNQASFYGQLAL